MRPSIVIGMMWPSAKGTGTGGVSGADIGGKDRWKKEGVLHHDSNPTWFAGSIEGAEPRSGYQGHEAPLPAATDRTPRGCLPKCRNSVMILPPSCSRQEPRCIEGAVAPEGLLRRRASAAAGSVPSPRASPRRGSRFTAMMSRKGCRVGVSINWGGPSHREPGRHAGLQYHVKRPALQDQLNPDCH